GLGGSWTAVIPWFLGPVFPDKGTTTAVVPRRLPIAAKPRSGVSRNDGEGHRHLPRPTRLSRLAAVDAAKRKTLEETTRYDPSEVEGRIFSEWMEGGYFHP